MTGILLHLVAIAHDRARAEMAEARRLAGWGCLLVRMGMGGRR